MLTFWASSWASFQYATPLFSFFYHEKYLDTSCFLRDLWLFNSAGRCFHSTDQLVSIRLRWSPLRSLRLRLRSLLNGECSSSRIFWMSFLLLILIEDFLLADTGCDSFSRSSSSFASLLGPSSSVGGLNFCYEPALGCWNIKVPFSSPWKFYETLVVIQACSVVESTLWVELFESYYLGVFVDRIGTATGPWAILMKDDDIEKDVLVIQ